MRTRTRAAFALAAGATLALGAPPLDFWPSTFVAIALFVIAMDGASMGAGALVGWITGASATLGSFYWIVGTVLRFTPIPLPGAVLAYLLLAAIAGLTLCVAGAIAGGVSSVLGYPAAVALSVFAAERFVPGIFPWQIASPLVFAPWIPQCADVIGVSGLGALLVAIEMVLVRALRRDTRPARWQWRLALGAFAALWIYGGVRTSMIRHAMDLAPRVRVALLQPAIPPAQRWEEMFHARILEGLQEQTHAAMREHPDLVVWSEGAYPYQLPDRAQIDGEADVPAYPYGTDVPIVIGVITHDEQGRRYNAAMIREMDGGLSRPVEKRMLVPFGEYVPVVGRFEWVRRSFPRADGLTPGQRPTVLVTSTGLRIGILNCFEDTMAFLASDLRDVDLLVNITNDAWFGNGPAPWAHLMLARWRAIENRRELVRSVNMGVTCEIDALGRLVQSLPLGTRGTLVVDAKRMNLHPAAPYFIEVAPWVALVVLALASAERLRRRLRQGSST